MLFVNSPPYESLWFDILYTISFKKESHMKNHIKASKCHIFLAGFYGNRCETFNSMRKIFHYSFNQMLQVSKGKMIVYKISKHNDMNENFVLFNWVPVSETKCQNQYVHSRLTKTYNLKRRNVCITPRPSKESSNWNRLIQYLHAHKPCPLNRCVLCIRLLCCCKTE